jgi:hypothetical protein
MEMRRGKPVNDFRLCVEAGGAMLLRSICQGYRLHLSTGGDAARVFGPFLIMGNAYHQFELAIPRIPRVRASA